MAAKLTNVAHTTLVDQLAVQISRNYTNAQSLVVLSQHNEAIALLEETVALSKNLSSNTPNASTSLPSTTDSEFLLSHI